MAELTEREIQDKFRDISTLEKMYTTIVQHEKNELNLNDTLMKIGGFAGGGQNGILFNYNDKDQRYIRNKYGYIQRKNNDSAEPNEHGIYFEKLYHLKLILEEKPKFQFDGDESDRLKTDLAGLKTKIEYIFLSEEEFIRTKYDSMLNETPLEQINKLLEFIKKDDLVLNLSNPINPNISNILTIAKKYYDQHSLRKIQFELNNFESNNFNFESREDRYYFARKCVIIGELLKEFMVDEDKKDASDTFELFTKIRDKLIHSHKIISAGQKKNEKGNDNDNLTENIKNIVESMNKMIQADDQNHLFVNYVDKKAALCLEENSQKMLNILMGNKSNPSATSQKNKSEEKVDKNSPKSILVLFDTKVKLAENISRPTKDTSLFTDLNAKYEECFKNIPMN